MVKRKFEEVEKMDGDDSILSLRRKRILFVQEPQISSKIDVSHCAWLTGSDPIDNKNHDNHVSISQELVKRDEILTLKVQYPVTIQVVPAIGSDCEYVGIKIDENRVFSREISDIIPIHEDERIGCFCDNTEIKWYFRFFIETNEVQIKQSSNSDIPVIVYIRNENTA